MRRRARPAQRDRRSDGALTELPSPVAFLRSCAALVNVVSEEDAMGVSRTVRGISATAAALAALAASATQASAHSGSAAAGAPARSVVAPDVPGSATNGNAAAARLALRYLGVPYVWGGAGPSGFDCSGLPSYVYAQIGRSVPHFTGAIWAAFSQVSREQLQAGDLVFFNGGEHVGIYLGSGRFVHSPHSGDVVKVSDLATYPGYVGAVRPS
jgi:peptidoglycan DL-endopeptidase CwlO